MSGAETTSSLEGAMEIEAQAAAWLREKNFDIWNDEKQAQLEEWLSQSAAHRVAYIRLNAAWGRTERVHALLRPAAQDTPSNHISTRMMRAGIAACVLLVAGLAAFAWQGSSTPEEKTFSTPVGGHETVKFADGSQIDLNTNTVLRTQISKRMRLVTLEKGEAFFRVKHDANRPFVTMVAGHKVTDLGTKFLIRNEPNRLEVALVEGRARFDAQARNVRPISVELQPGDVVVAKNNEISLTRISPPAVARELGWRHGVVIFDNTALSDAAAEFNRYSATKLVVEGTSAASLKINGTFRVDNLEAFAETAQDALGLRLKHRPNQIVISP